MNKESFLTKTLFWNICLMEIIFLLAIVAVIILMLQPCDCPTMTRW